MYIDDSSSTLVDDYNCVSHLVNATFRAVTPSPTPCSTPRVKPQAVLRGNVVQIYCSDTGAFKNNVGLETSDLKLSKETETKEIQQAHDRQSAGRCRMWGIVVSAKGVWCRSSRS